MPVFKKDWPKAETEETRLLKMDGSQATLSDWLGTALVSQNKANPEKQPIALYHFAHASTYDGANSLDAAGRKLLQDYLTRAYKQYHCSEDGLPALLTTAKPNTFPPADWPGIKDCGTLQAEDLKRQQEEDAKDPMKTLWVKTIKTNLTGDGGPAFFESTVKDALLPGGANGVSKFQGQILSMTPATRPKEILLGIEKGDVGDATLKFEEALPGKMEAGEELQFEGIAKAYTKEPFMITFEVEQEKLEGWTGKGATAPPKAKPPAAKPPP